MNNENSMMEAIEEPQPLLPPGKYFFEEQKPSYFINLAIFRWVMKKFALVRFGKDPKNNQGTEKSEKTKENVHALYQEPTIAEKIPIKYAPPINHKKYQEYVVYESYKPKNLREMQDFLHFILQFRKILPNNNGEILVPESWKNVDEILSSKSVSQEIKDYYNSEVETKLPQRISKQNI